MSFTLLSVIILTITALIVYIEVRRGYKQGLSKSLINVALILFSAIIGLFDNSEIFAVAVLIVGLVVGIGCIVAVQRKYNNGVF